VVYKRSKEKGFWDEEQRHNDNDDRHNEIFEFSHHLAINFSAIVSIGCGIMNNSSQEILEYCPANQAIPSDSGKLMLCWFRPIALLLDSTNSFNCSLFHGLKHISNL